MTGIMITLLSMSPTLLSLVGLSVMLFLVHHLPRSTMCLLAAVVVLVAEIMAPEGSPKDLLTFFIKTPNKVKAMVRWEVDLLRPVWSL